MNKILLAVGCWLLAIGCCSAQSTDTVIIDGLPYVITYRVDNNIATLPAQQLYNTLWLLGNMAENIEAYRAIVPRLQEDAALADSTIAGLEDIICLQDERIDNLQEGLTAINRVLDECRDISGRAIDEADKQKKLGWWKLAGGIVVGVVLGVLVTGGE